MHAKVENHHTNWILILERDEFDAVMAALRLYGSQDYPSKRYQTTIAKGMREQLLGLTSS